MVNISVINGLVFFGCHFGVVNCLDLVPISEIGVVCCLYFIVVIISLGCC